MEITRYEPYSDIRKHWWHYVCKYGFYISMTVLAFTNILFFYVNWNSYCVSISNEAILLSVVGFFFAFAGINIYSIFNTNIEAEKQTIRELAREYEAELSVMSQMMEFPKNVLQTYQLACYLTSADVIQPSSMDWMDSITIRSTKLKAVVTELKNKHLEEKYEIYNEHLVSMAQGILVLLNQHNHAITYNRFFKGLSEADQQRYNEKLTGLIELMDKLQYTDDEQEELDDTSNKTFCGKLKDILKYSKKTLFGAK